MSRPQVSRDDCKHADLVGLDSYNAYNVIESLKTLARTYNRTVIFTIHQPQSNIVALFDRLVLLAKGQLVYSGESSKAQPHFEKVGHACPPGYNIADYLIDLSVEASGDHRGPKANGKTNGHITPPHSISHTDPENGFVHPQSIDSDDEEEPQKQTVVGEIKRKAHQLLGAFTSSSSSSGSATPDSNQIPEKLASLVLACRASDDSKIVEAEISRIQSGQTPAGAPANGRDVGEETELLRGYKTAGYWAQFKLLSGRTFRNLYRYVRHSILVSITDKVCQEPAIDGDALCPRDHCRFRLRFVLLQSYQRHPWFPVSKNLWSLRKWLILRRNRLGLFLFILSLFGFSTLSSLGIFANERMLFMRERCVWHEALQDID